MAAKATLATTVARAIPLLIVLGLLLATTSGAAGSRRPPRAQAQAAISGETSYGELRRNREGGDELDTAVDGDGVSATRALVKVRVGRDGAGEAVSRAFEVDVLDGFVKAAGLRRESDGGGAVYGLYVEGQYIGDVKRKRTIPVTGGEVVLNTGSAALRVKTGSRDIRVAVARAATRPFATPTPSPSPSPSPSPKPTETATAKPSATATPKRRKGPTARARLTKGGYAFPIFGRARVADNFGGARPAPIVSHQGVDIFAPFGSPVVAVQDGKLDHVGTLPISGNRLWLHTKNGDAFFYAHLSAFAKATRNGATVKAGTVLGFTGNTGDAEPTPPHVHFEVHPGGMDEDPVDPYPIVTAWKARDDVPPGAWLQQLGADATERPGALVTVRDFIAE